MRSRFVVLAALALAVAALAGCGEDEEPVSAPPSSSAPSSPSSPPTITRPDGRVIVEEGLPAGFPVDDIPLIDAEVINGTVAEPGSPYAWSVVLQPDGDIADLADDAAARLEAAGFTAGAKQEQENLQVRDYRNADYRVGFTATESSDGVIATYVVSKLS